MINNNPKVSVIMSVYNCEKYIRQAIESILNQSFRDFEFIIVDDCSTDKSLEIIRKYQDKDNRIKIILNSENIGLTKSLNKAIKQTQGDYVARMDCDDISLLERLEKQIRFMENNPKIVLCGTLGWIINNNGDIVKEKNIATDYKTIKKKLLFNNQFIHSSLFIRKDVLRKEGLYDEDFNKSQDYELVLRLASKYPVVNLSDYLIKWRVNNNSLSWSDKRQEKDALKARKYAITRYGYPKMAGLFHLIIRSILLFIPQKIKKKRYENKNSSSHYSL